MKSKSLYMPYILAILATLMWGTIAVGNKMLLGRFSEMEVLFLSSFLVTIMMAVLLLATGRIRILMKMNRRDYLIIAALGMIGTFLYNMFYNYGIHHLKAQEACIINYLWPMMIMVFSCIILHERLTIRKIVAVFLSFVGVIIIVTRLDFASFHPDSISGVASCLMAAVCYGLFSVLNKKKFYDQYVALTIFYCVTALVSAVIMLIQGGFSMPHGAAEIGIVLWEGFFANGIAYLFWCLALLHGDTAKISNLAYITPFLTILFSRIFLKEDINIYSFLGLIFILLGIFIQMGGHEDAVS